VAEPVADTRDLTDVATELAARVGLLDDYLHALNRGAGTTVPLRGEGYDFTLSPGRMPAVADVWDRVARAATHALTGGATVHGLDWFRTHGAFFVPFATTRYYLHGAMVARGLRYELPYQERIKRVGEELAARLHERGITWWDVQLDEYQPLPRWKDFPGLWRQPAVLRGRAPHAFPFWLVTSRSMQYSWGANVSLPVLADVARHVTGHFGVMLNRDAAARLGIAEGDLVELESPTGTTRGRAVLREGVRPDVVVVLQQFGHWATPFARELGMPNLNEVATMDLALTDATGSGADLVPVAVRPAHARPVPAGAEAPATTRPAACARAAATPWPGPGPVHVTLDEMYIRGL
jgi:phenylacetyl-CoA:acceptor oxidoreductase